MPRSISLTPLGTPAQPVMREGKFAPHDVRQHKGIEIRQTHGSIDVIDPHSQRGGNLDQALGIRFRIRIPGWDLAGLGKDRPAATKLSVMSVKCSTCAAVSAQSSCGCVEA